jgi:hypothetical protein
VFDFGAIIRGALMQIEQEEHQEALLSDIRKEMAMPRMAQSGGMQCPSRIGGAINP